MNPTRKVTRRIMLAIAVIAIGTAASCNLMNTDIESATFEQTGRVLDAETKGPIEGAYVLGVYEQVDLGMAGSARYCFKTKGMVTGKDGKYNFPLEKRRSSSLSTIAAIKADYYFEGERQLSQRDWKAQNKETYMNRDVYLKKQDAAKPKFGDGFTDCERPESRAAVEPAIRFLEMVFTENKKYSKNGTDSVEFFIKRMQSAPDTASSPQR